MLAVVEVMMTLAVMMVVVVVMVMVVPLAAARGVRVRSPRVLAEDE